MNSTIEKYAISLFIRLVILTGDFLLAIKYFQNDIDESRIVRYIDYGERRNRESRTAPILENEKNDRAKRLGINERTGGAFSLPASTVTCGYKTKKPTHYKACERDTPQTPNRKKQRKEKTEI